MARVDYLTGAANSRCFYDLAQAELERLRRYRRRTDVPARLGSDEFVILLPETDQASVRAALTKLHAALLAEMRRAGWPVTFSVGALTCAAAPATTDQLVRLADELMYTVNHETKHALKFATFAG